MEEEGEEEEEEEEEEGPWCKFARERGRRGKVGHPSFLPSPFRCRAVDENGGDRNAAQTGLIVGL